MIKREREREMSDKEREREREREMSDKEREREKEGGKRRNSRIFYLPKKVILLVFCLSLKFK